jgi:S-DNA-T family DNA segregation ATPase FtsK/SpoIIIE
VASVSELDDAVPRVLLLLDGYPAFQAAMERVRMGRDIATIQRLAGDGRALGIHVVATADRRAGVPGGLAGVVPARVVLRMADDDDYPALGVPRAVAAGADLPPGRGFAGDGLPVQLAILGGSSAGERQALERLGSEAAARHPGQTAPRIRTLPERVERDRLPAPDAPLGAVMGIGAGALRAVGFELRDEHFLIAGPLRSGRSTALLTAVASLRRADPGVELHALAPRRSPLVDEAGWESLARGGEECKAACDRLLALLERPADAPVAVVVIDDGTELADVAALETLARRGRDAGVRLLAAVETQSAQRAYGGWLRELRSGRRGLLLQPEIETDGELLGVKLPRGTSTPLGPGRGFLVEAGAVELVQVAA